jgi:DNA-binding NtrC family response regulator
MDSRTVPLGASSLAVQALRVLAIDGPDEGKGATSTGDALRVGTAEDNHLVLTDRAVSRVHLELSPSEEGVRVVDCSSTNGTRVGSTIIERATVPLETTIRLGRTSLKLTAAGEIAVPLHRTDQLAGLRGRSVGMRRVMDQVERAARSDVSVLVTGESGSGKELVARALHDLGARASGPFVTIDCGALAPSLVASELFGHEKGAFTGADRQHQGAFEQANGGTLFLDEIGELPTAMQAALLGALERRKLKRVGGTREVSFDVRVVSATHRDLWSEINTGRFRLDLYYRLAVVTLTVPPLRERADDIPMLVRHFLEHCGFDGDVDALIPPPRMLELCGHRWPGNVRELRNVVEATVAMGVASPTSGGPIAVSSGDDLIGSVLERPYKDARAVVLESFELRYLRGLLARAQGNVSRAAREAGLDRSHLTQLVQKHKLR